MPISANVSDYKPPNFNLTDATDFERMHFNVTRQQLAITAWNWNVLSQLATFIIYL